MEVLREEQIRLEVRQLQERLTEVRKNIRNKVCELSRKVEEEEERMNESEVVPLEAKLIALKKECSHKKVTKYGYCEYCTDYVGKPCRHCGK